MAEYRVKWEIDIEADSPEEAAREAHTIMLDPASCALVFDVYKNYKQSDESFDKQYSFDFWKD